MNNITTPQEAVDFFAKHLRTQGTLARDANGHCRYRMPTGEACGIGGMILDEHYSEELENNASEDKSVVEALCLSGVEYTRICIAAQSRLFFAELQYLHDNCPLSRYTKQLGLPEQFETRLQQFCGEYGLQYPDP